MTLEQTIHYLQSLIKSYPEHIDFSPFQKLIDRLDFRNTHLRPKWGSAHDHKAFAIETFEQFILLLNDLKSLNLAPEQLQSIEAKIASLDLQKEAQNKRRYIYKRKLQFEKYLIKHHSIVKRGYYLLVGAAFGSHAGIIPSFVPLALNASNTIVFVVLFGGFVLGLVLGAFIGRRFDRKAQRENRVLEHFYAFTSNLII